MSSGLHFGGRGASPRTDVPTAIYGKMTGPWADMVDPDEAARCAAGLEHVAPIVVFAKKRMAGRVCARFRPAQGEQCAALELYVVHPHELAAEGAQAVMREVRKFVEQVAPAARHGVGLDKASVGLLKCSHVSSIDAPVVWPGQ